jgi:hypothetical protein
MQTKAVGKAIAFASNREMSFPCVSSVCRFFRSLSDHFDWMAKHAASMP